MRRKIRFSDVIKLIILRIKYELREGGKAAGYAIRR
jgi:hypothetical protein